MKLIQSISNDDINSTPIETINAIKKAGFDGVFLQWYDGDYKTFDVPLLKQVELAKKLNLEIEFAHLSYLNINDIWLDDSKGDEFVKKITSDINDVKKFGINMGILHLSKTSNPPAFNEIGLKRFQKICDYAEKLNFKIAFENTRIKGYLEYVLDNIKNKNVGVCFDAGHCHCYFKDDFNFEKFKNRIIAVHLHDNFGESDEHLLPLDGTINYNEIMQKLKESGYKGPITLECGYSSKYQNMTLEEFYKTSYERAEKLREIFENCNLNGESYER